MTFSMIAEHCYAVYHLCWLSLISFLCWVSICWMSLCRVSWRRGLSCPWGIFKYELDSCTKEENLLLELSISIVIHFRVENVLQIWKMIFEYTNFVINLIYYTLISNHILKIIRQPTSNQRQLFELKIWNIRGILYSGVETLRSTSSLNVSSKFDFFHGHGKTDLRPPVS